MNILSKLNEITINNNDRIAETDSKFCVNQYYQYVAAREALKQALDIIKSVYDKEKNPNSNYGSYLDDYYDINYLEKRLEQIKRGFVSDIVNHFSRQYNVTLDKKVINEKYDLNLNHNDIIGEIFVQLDGFSFEEKAVHELIQATKNTIYNFDKKVTIKKASLSITDYVWWDSWTWSGLRISWDSKLGTFFQALSHFENGSVETLHSLKRMFEHLKEGSNKYDIFSKYEFDYKKIKSIKVFKNRKITVEFKDHALAQEFANTYLKK
ncbi:hypothetical protein [Bacillus subtilis]|uniref:hypothetical protein n=1 Tax=Bacillus subtilis TaxID=1423 RepID=UPI002675B424|nr:hypothetical protein [Bacillus subtilis]MDO3655414.1 hypothetical protein [Bacillus subtilis]MEC2297060.1 hypothetical protein [Bacillus subtilis]